MRLSDLLGVEVLAADGRHLGRVHDVRLIQDGPVLAGWGPAFRVDQILVGRRSIGTRLGYDRATVHRPWLLRLLFGRGHPQVIPWSSIRNVGADRLVAEITG